MSFNWEIDQVRAQVLSEETLSATDAGKRVRDFLNRRHVTELLSADDYSRLCGLHEALQELQEGKREPRKKKKRSHSETEAAEDEPDRKKRRRRSDVT